MLKPIREVSEEERNKRALLVLNGLSLECDFKRPQDFVDTVFRLTHAVVGCRDNQECSIVQQGLDEIQRLEISLKNARIIDIENVLLGESNETSKF
jgi:hypothetical protein